jgi:hypothetical protein
LQQAEHNTSEAGIKVVEYPAGSVEYEQIMDAQSKRHRELEQLRANNGRYEISKGPREEYRGAKKQVVDLQAQLPAAQDHISELQQKLLDRPPPQEVISTTTRADG